MRKVFIGAAALACTLAFAAPASAQEEECDTLANCVVWNVETAAADPQGWTEERVRYVCEEELHACAPEGEDECGTLVWCVVWNVETAAEDPVGYVEDRLGG
jgi:hypothetical protein